MGMIFQLESMVHKGDWIEAGNGRLEFTEELRPEEAMLLIDEFMEGKTGEVREHFTEGLNIII